ncbi:MAG TPA: DUF4178 domain-containing protein [Cyclobacteriaceae bacterium]|nr:DUF4178 domain-containing protein [Cyclobacteriaceae bacterium]
MTCKSCGVYFVVHSNINDTFKSKYEPVIPVGTKGIFDGKTYEVMGFSVKREKKYRYLFREYFLFSPYHGIAFLAEFDGHWNFLKPYANHPWSLAYTDEDPYVNGSMFQLYARYRAEVMYATGEYFNDMIGVTEESEHWEHIAPPHILTYEQSKTMASSFIGKYTTQDEIAKAFKLDKSKLPNKIGMGYTEPIGGSFTGRALVVTTALSILLAFILMMFFANTADDKNLLHMSYTQADLKDSTKMIQTESFELVGTKNLVLQIYAPVENNWFFAEYSMINDVTNEEFIFTKEVEYYYGYEGGENWSEGSKTSEVFLSRVPPGKYHFNIYPEFGTFSGKVDVAVFHDTVFYTNFWLTAVALLLFPLGVFVFRHYKDVKRWQDSDYSPYSSDDE